MKFLLIICMLTISCSSAHTAINQQKQEAKKSSTAILDSVGKKSIDTGAVKNLLVIDLTTIDSGYDKVVEEQITEVIDSAVTRREIKRTIKEKGQKRTEQSSTTIQKDSTGKKVQEQAAVKKLQKQDSTGVTVTNNKQVKRVTFLPWWLWIIAAIVVVIAVWKRSSIINFLKRFI